MTREGLYGYPYLKHLIQLWPDGWVDQMAKINEAVVINNFYMINGGGVGVTRPFKRQ